MAIAASLSGATGAFAIGYAISAVQHVDQTYNGPIGKLVAVALGVFSLCFYVCAHKCWRDRYKPF